MKTSGVSGKAWKICIWKCYESLLRAFLNSFLESILVDVFLFQFSSSCNVEENWGRLKIT